MRKFGLILMLLAAVAAAVLAPLAEINKPKSPRGINKLLFFPSRYPEGNWAPEGLIYEDVFFTAEDNTRLHGWFCRAPSPIATILFAHGNAGHVASRTAFLRRLQSELKVAVFIFDYRGYGRSSGVPTIEGALLDARAARSKLRQLARVQDSDIMLMGESIGGAVAVQLASESPTRALILQSTFSSLRDVANIHYPKQSSIVPPSQLDSVTQIAQFHGALFQSHGEKDSVVPCELGEKLFGAANDPKEFLMISNAGHNDWLTDEYIVKLDEFLTRLTPTSK